MFSLSTQTSPKTTRDITKYSVINMNRLLVGFALAASLVANLVQMSSIETQQNEIKRLQNEIKQLQNEVKVLKEYKESCGLNGIKKMANEYVIDPVQHAYKALAAKVGGQD